MSGNFDRKLYKNLFTIGSYNYGYTLFQFFASMVLSRLLTPVEYGIVALITVFTGFISFFKDAGLSYLVIREDYRNRFYRAIQMVSLVIGLGLAFLICILAYPISLFYQESSLIFPTLVMGLVLVIESLAIVPTALLKKRLQFRELGRINFLVYVSGSILTIILAFLQFSYWALIIGQVYSTLFLLLLIQRKAGLKFNFIKASNFTIGFRKARSILFNVSGSRLIHYWADNTDNLVIGKAFGVAKLGIYNRAFQLLTMQLNLVSGVFNTVLFPSLKQVSKNNGNFEKEYRTALGGMSLVILPIMIILVHFSTPTIKLIWGIEWMEVAEITPFFGVLSVTYILSRTFGSIYILYHSENLLFRIGIMSTIITVSMVLLGMQFSISTIAFMISMGFVALILPITLYIAFIRNFKFPIAFLIEFWLIKIIGSLFSLIGLYFDIPELVYTGTFILVTQTLFQEYHQLLSFWNFVRAKLGFEK